MQPLFSEKEIEMWKEHHFIKKQCCKFPKFRYFVIQERRGDEIPTAYRECLICKTKMRA